MEAELVVKRKGLMLTLLRGVSGSGKSQRANAIAQSCDGVIVTTDDFWNDEEGNYNFDYSLIGEAHNWAREKADRVMAWGESVIIDNTNARWWEMFPYLEMAKKYGYPVEVIMVGTLEPEDIELYAERNIHKTPVEIIRRQADNFEMMMDPEAGYHLEKLRQEISGILKSG
jgi:predicted kinase